MTGQQADVDPISLAEYALRSHGEHSIADKLAALKVSDDERIARILAHSSPLGYPGALALIEAQTRLLEASALASRVSTPPSEEADEIRAEAVRETRRYIDRIHRNGLVPLGTVLADMEAAAYRMEQGMTARGSTRRPPVPAVPVLPTEPEPFVTLPDGRSFTLEEVLPYLPTDDEPALPADGVSS